jgi:hypothetical protein
VAAAGGFGAAEHATSASAIQAYSIRMRTTLAPARPPRPAWFSLAADGSS